jgi:hypothetical protein
MTPSRGYSNSSPDQINPQNALCGLTSENCKGPQMRIQILVNALYCLVIIKLKATLEFLLTICKLNKKFVVKIVSELCNFT